MGGWKSFPVYDRAMLATSSWRASDSQSWKKSRNCEMKVSEVPMGTLPPHLVVTDLEKNTLGEVPSKESQGSL